jgi:hypothetical protein
MHRVLIPLLSAAALAACSSDHDIARGQDNSAVTSETLGADCQSVCEIVVDCDAGGSSQDCACTVDNECECTTYGPPRTVSECVSDCQKVFGPGLSQGVAACQDAVTVLFACVEAESCSGLGTPEVPGSCIELSRPAERACDLDDDPPVATTPTGDRYVTCQAGSSVGREPSGPAEPGLVCEKSWHDCSDGHDYRVTCVDPDGTGGLRCSCIVDERVEGNFEDATVCGTFSLDQTAINRGCGWNLL